MKKSLLFLCLCLAATVGSAQVIFYVEAPSPNEGNYDFTYADAATWGVGDLTDPAESITSNMVLVDDGTGSTPLACDPILNGTDLVGNVAVLYRGDCEFGAKALACETEGAIGVIIINNIPGAPIDMGAGADGATVTIPVTMISDADGAVLAAEIATGLSTVFIGSKLGFYDYDMGFYPQNILMPEAFSNIQLLSQDDTEFSVELGAWVFNYGAFSQDNVQLRCVINDGADIYDEISATGVTVPAGDSIFIPLPAFTQSTYDNGSYTGTYTITSDEADEFDPDNSLPCSFTVSDSIYGYSPVTTALAPEGDAYFRGASSTASNSACLAFNDPNAERVGIAGMTFSAASSQNPDTTTMDGEFVEIYAYSWNDAFTDVSDAAITSLDEIASGEYIYLEDLQQGNVYIPFEEPVILEDGQWYLFCVTHYGENLFLGYDSDLDYNLNQDNYQMPLFPGESDGAWFLNGFGTDVIPAITVRMFDADAIGIEEETSAIELEAYPNPATTTLNIPLTENKGNVDMSIYDLSGKLVSTQNVSMDSNMLEVDVTSIPAGTYVFDLDFANGEKATINVVVAH